MGMLDGGDEGGNASNPKSGGSMSLTGTGETCCLAALLEPVKPAGRVAGAGTS